MQQGGWKVVAAAAAAAACDHTPARLTCRRSDSVALLPLRQRISGRGRALRALQQLTTAPGQRAA